MPKNLIDATTFHFQAETSMTDASIAGATTIGTGSNASTADTFSEIS